MNYPNFFTLIPTITLKDPLSDFLNTFENGEVEFTYLDVVKSAGHSCPTVAGAYLMTYHALKALYGDEKAIRGDIKISFKESVDEGVAGVIANVMGQITGASINGFQGINGKFARNGLIEFNKDIEASAKFTRVDTGKSVECFYNPSSVKGDAMMPEIMQKAMNGDAFAKKEFGLLWQKRVEALLINHFNDLKVIKIIAV